MKLNTVFFDIIYHQNLMDFLRILFNVKNRRKHDASTLFQNARSSAPLYAVKRLQILLPIACAKSWIR
jgi:hypothetical protein